MLGARVQTGVVELNVDDYQHVTPAHAVVATYTVIFVNSSTIVDPTSLRFRIRSFSTVTRSTFNSYVSHLSDLTMYGRVLDNLSV